MTTPAGWYPDPTNEGQQRYWDGERWTDYMAPLAGDPAASGAAATDATAGASAATDATATWSAPAAPGDTADPAAAAAPGRSRGKLAGGIAAGVLVVAAGAFAATQLAGADGGADSPEGAVTALFEALGDEDVVGMAEVVLPGERRTYVDPLLEGVGHLQRWGVLDESLDTSDVAGIDLEIEGLETRVDEVSDDIVNVYVDGAISASVDGEELPIGDLLSDRALEGQDMSELDADEEPAEFSDVRITAVREDGRWYVSALYTIAEEAREEAGALPIHADDGVQPVGADSPEEAVDGMLDALADLDLEAMIARLNPDEAAALQRYAPLFLDDAQTEIDAMVDETGLEITVDDAAYDVTRRDGFAVVVPTSIAISGTGDGETMSFEVDGDCTTFTVDGETEEYCTEGSPDLDLTDTPVGDLEEIFSDMDPIGLVVVEHGGRWYVSPIRSYSEAILAVMRTIERDDVERLLDAIEDGSLEAWLEEEFETILEEAFGFSSFDEFAGATAELDAIDGGWSEYEPTAEIEALLDACGAGDMAACDDLYWATSVGSDEEAFAETCGETMPPQSGGTCVERSGGGGEGSTTETTMSAAFTYGDDPTLDALWDVCEAGDGVACDDLYAQAPFDSEYERFGQSCGNRQPDDNLDWCEDLMAGAGS